MTLHEVLAGVGVGLAGGITSGLLGVSPGGGLVVFAVLLLGANQHMAQGISLVAQIPPTGLSGIKRYREGGSRTPLRWLVLLTIGFLAGGVAGAYAASGVSDVILRWVYVAYLVVLDAMLLLSGRRHSTDKGQSSELRELTSTTLVVVGLSAGFSSGFMGIGGGLATTVGLGVVLGVPQHQAQMVSLVLSLIPTTIPSAWIYWREGWTASWLALAGVIVGLIVGTDLGARIANRIDRTALRVTLIVFVSGMAFYMAFKALS